MRSVCGSDFRSADRDILPFALQLFRLGTLPKLDLIVRAVSGLYIIRKRYLIALLAFFSVRGPELVPKNCAVLFSDSWRAALAYIL